MSERSPDPCPICDKPVPATSEVRPFCSPRCKWVDLGRWLQGDYVVPGETVADFDVAPPPEHGEDGS